MDTLQTQLQDNFKPGLNVSKSILNIKEMQI